MDVDLQVVQDMDRLNLKFCLGPDPLRVCGCLQVVEDMGRLNLKLCLGPNALRVCGCGPPGFPGHGPSEPEAPSGARPSEGLWMSPSCTRHGPYEREALSGTRQSDGLLMSPSSPGEALPGAKHSEGPWM